MAIMTKHLPGVIKLMLEISGRTEVDLMIRESALAFVTTAVQVYAPFPSQPLLLTSVVPTLRLRKHI